MNFDLIGEALGAIDCAQEDFKEEEFQNCVEFDIVKYSKILVTLFEQSANEEARKTMQESVDNFFEEWLPVKD